MESNITQHTESAAINLVIHQLTTGKKQDICRWHVLGRVELIVKVLKEEKQYEHWMLAELERINEDAKNAL